MRHRKRTRSAAQKPRIEILKDIYARITIAVLAVSLLWLTPLSFMTFIIQDDIFLKPSLNNVGELV